MQFVPSGEMTEEKAAEVLHSASAQLTAVETWLRAQGRTDEMLTAARLSGSLADFASEVAPGVAEVQVAGF